MARMAGVLLGIGGTSFGVVASMTQLALSDIWTYALFGLSGFTILAGIVLTLRQKEGDRLSGVTVQSYNQSGGITAHTVNVGRQKFELTPDLIGEIVAASPPEKPIHLVTIGDEARPMGERLAATLRGHGYEVDEAYLVSRIPLPTTPVTLVPCEKWTLIWLYPEA